MNNNKDFAVFAIIEKIDKGIPLVMERGYFPSGEKWKLPGGRPVKINDSKREALKRKVFRKIKIVVIPGEVIFKKAIFKEKRVGHNFIVLRADYSYGDPIAIKHEIKKVKLCSRAEIENMIEKGEILGNHATALKKFFKSYGSL
ncbi:MAG: NUDIX hydrolase [Thermodesulfobacteriota bacterium]